MGLRDDADIGEMAECDALEFEETCGRWRSAAAVWRDGLENKEGRRCNLRDHACRALNILRPRLCRNNDLHIDIDGARDR